MLHAFPTAAADGTLPAACHWIDLIDPSAAEVATVEQRYDVVVPDLDALTRIDASSRLRAAATRCT